ncbi:MAG: hypothetical protein V3T17_03225 [Pseudomonadales bacterium]
MLNKIIAFIALLAAVIYGDLESTEMLAGTLLPIVFLLSFVYLVGIPCSIFVLLGGVIFYFIDFESRSVFRGIILPLLLGVDIIALAVVAVKQGLIGVGMGADSGGLGGDGGGDGC